MDEKRSVDRTVDGVLAENDWRGKREHLHQEFGYALKELLELWGSGALQVREYRIHLEVVPF